MRKAEIKLHDQTAGWLTQDEEGYHFVYDSIYLQSESPHAVSLTLPLRAASFTSKTMLPFFDGLIPEGWLLEVAERNWKLGPRDRMGLLMSCCRDCIGAVSVHPVFKE
ncbi:HipA N-terminal domain-containing protein [Chlorobium sp. KB01]|uniref:HipA N-terminal domain-containing protein n=1 Tax=Chlorobium sp. KB01 TaxID=1917528 RepID=UPI0009770756|nr:HipA N-terminal domain-containing protein [Chlorobium sp. KB01]